MKPFVFPLERVLRFRRDELERAAARLAEATRLSQRARETAAGRRALVLSARRNLTQLPEFSGLQLGVLDSWWSRLTAEGERAERQLPALEAKRHELVQTLIRKRQNVKVFEVLKERRRRAHARGAAKQADREAAELYGSRRARHNWR